MRMRCGWAVCETTSPQSEVTILGKGAPPLMVFTRSSNGAYACPLILFSSAETSALRYAVASTDGTNPIPA